MIENKLIRTKDSRLIAEHRYIMEQHLGRKLESTEIVHHINWDHNDNRLENLKIMTNSEHSRYHRTNPRIYSDVKRITNGKQRKNTSLEESIVKKAEKQAKQLGFNFSAYITYLINKDLNGAIEIIEKHEVVKNDKISSAIDSILG